VGAGQFAESFTYDLKPEMSAPEVTKTVLEKIRASIQPYHDELRNPDMVGHTGVVPAILSACEVVDHGMAKSAKRMSDKTALCSSPPTTATAKKCTLSTIKGKSFTKTARRNRRPKFQDKRCRHRLRPKDLVSQVKLRPEGVLADVAPTVLEFYGLRNRPR